MRIVRTRWFGYRRWRNLVPEINVMSSSPDFYSSRQLMVSWICFNIYLTKWLPYEKGGKELEDRWIAIARMLHLPYTFGW